ncbi:MAG TPA: trimeric intracellular cation channel family protein [Paraburkholderia sp.]|uniref:trimeric intracellular cation channel family protein n=1 Tax=Paraburkholderia sp. TaxID=1926495 RepID=UPI002B49BD72|nr:trimeric intracellular cation channel family protein [Paraburkholderia sp.]HKR46753.1 trimeric intracellular cation channel family protein [Paraburkholderia sp.]
MLTAIYLLAITAEAMTGALAAGRRNMDIFGVSVIAFVTALGGGTVRDMLLGHFPVAWTQHPAYLYLVLSAGLMTTLIAPGLHRLNRIFVVLDAMGLMAFSLIGCNVALSMHYPTDVVIISGVITGVCGGVLRDVFCNDTPLVFRRELYASVSLVTCSVFVFLRARGVNDDTNLAVSFLIGMALRALAIWRDWHLPTFSYKTKSE